MNNSRTLMIITTVGIFLVILLVIVSAVLLKKNASSASPSSSLSPAPAGGTTSPNEPTSLPATVAPTFTGARDVTFAPPAAALVDQKEELRNKVPLDQPDFTINFDYTADKFTVQLKGDKNAATAALTDWLQKNYPSIPHDRFMLQ